MSRHVTRFQLQPPISRSPDLPLSRSPVIFQCSRGPTPRSLRLDSLRALAAAAGASPDLPISRHLSGLAGPHPRSLRQIRRMSHPLVLALFDSPSAASRAARELHTIGVDRERISVVARSHDEEGALADQMGATPGADIEDSRTAARLGELGGQVLAAIALVMPGIGPIVTAGPLSAGLGEAAGHVAGSVASVLSGAGLSESRAEALQRGVEAGAVLVGVHAVDGDPERIRAILQAAGATEVETASWADA